MVSTRLPWPNDMWVNLPRMSLRNPMITRLTSGGCLFDTNPFVPPTFLVPTLYFSNLMRVFSATIYAQIPVSPSIAGWLKQRSGAHLLHAFLWFMIPRLWGTWTTVVRSALQSRFKTHVDFWRLGMQFHQFFPFTACTAIGKHRIQLTTKVCPMPHCILDSKRNTVDVILFFAMPPANCRTTGFVIDHCYCTIDNYAKIREFRWLLVFSVLQWVNGYLIHCPWWPLSLPQNTILRFSWLLIPWSKKGVD